jgi:hypothetical protein
VIFDLVHYGGFSYEDVLSMPVFERDFYHRLTVDAIKDEREFQLALHGRKKKAKR